ncbi:hypothetical protein Tco_0609575 [Tanacetum coccineum]
MTRPDISCAVQHRSQIVSSPKEPHLQAAMHLLRYLKGSINKGLFYPVQTNMKVASFSDADWASYIMTKKSLTGYCIFLGHSLVSWKTKKQATVSRSSTRAELQTQGIWNAPPSGTAENAYIDVIFPKKGGIPPVNLLS